MCYIKLLLAVLHKAGQAFKSGKLCQLFITTPYPCNNLSRCCNFEISALFFCDLLCLTCASLDALSLERKMVLVASLFFSVPVSYSCSVTNLCVPTCLLLYSFLVAARN